MFRVAAFLSIFMLLLASGASQLVWAHSPDSPPRKFDEFGKLRHCDLTARLDNLAIQIQYQPSASAAIIAYGPKGNGYGSGKNSLARIKDYLVNSRGIEPNKIITIYGGGNVDLNEPRIQLWVIPKGAPLPEPEKQETNLETFQGLLVQESTGDDFGMEFYAEDGMGAGIPGSTDASFAELLSVQKKAIGYIVVHSGDDLSPGAWRNVAQQQVEAFKSLKVDTSRLKIIHGGRQQKTTLQLWVLPKDAAPPITNAPDEPLNRTVRVGDFYAGTFDKKNQKNFVKRLADTLQADKSVRAFIVVRLEQPIPEEPVDATETPVVEQVETPDVEAPTEPIEEEPEVDLTQLVEKFRLELAKNHRITEDRITVVFTTAPETSSSYISLWIVPKGAPLPDPNESEAAPAVEEPPAKPETPKVAPPTPVVHVEAPKNSHEVPVSPKRP